MILHNFFDYQAKVRGNNIFASHGDASFTYAEAYAEANRLANGLIAAGLGVGDRFIYLSKNSIDVVIAYVAASKCGAVPVALNWRLVPTEWAYIIKDSGARLIIAQSEFCLGINSIRAELSAVERCFLIDGTSSGWFSYRDYVASQSITDPDIEIDENGILYQMYTSGTTGYPKGAMLSHKSVISNTIQSMVAMGVTLCSEDKCLVIMPLFHAGATSFAIGAIVNGATMEVHSEFDAHALVNSLAGGITSANLVPAMLQACFAQVEDVNDRDYSALKCIIYGASAITEETLYKTLETFDCDVHQGFGQTESAAVLTFLNADDHRHALADNPELLKSAGRAVLSTKIRIVDENDNEVSTGTIGEIIAKGPQVMNGYWGMPEATAKTLAGGWLHTGDAGYLDENGYLFIKDRLKDMVISGGENIYTREVENALSHHPQIQDVAVIGVPDEKYGEAVKAFIVLAEGAELAVADIITYARTRLAGYKVPRIIEFLTEIPRNPSGKILKKDLRLQGAATDKEKI